LVEREKKLEQTYCFNHMRKDQKFILKQYQLGAEARHFILYVQKQSPSEAKDTSNIHIKDSY
jgi:hypothetical protein